MKGEEEGEEKVGQENQRKGGGVNWEIRGGEVTEEEVEEGDKKRKEK